jgi:hypothetical protein
MKKYKYLIVILVFFLSCKSRIIVSHDINKSGSLIFNIKSDSWFSKKQEIRDLYIIDLSNQNFMWLIKSEDGEAKYVPIVEYCKTPNGFIEKKSCKELEKEKKYRIIVSGWGSSGDHDFIYKY